MTQSHSVYLLKAVNYQKVYIGYTVDFPHRLRQHNGELVGGAKKTSRWRPWTPICVVTGFIDNHQGLRFEGRLQHSGRKPAGTDVIVWYLKKLAWLLGDWDRGGEQAWPKLKITWYMPYQFQSSPY